MATKNTADHIKYFADQFDDEEVLMVFRKHPVVMRKGLVLACLGPLFGVLPAAIKPTLGFGWFFGGLAAGFVLGFLLILPAWISWYYSVFIVTDQRFIQIKQKGMFNKSVVDIGLNQIQMINYEVAGLQETILGYGTLMMQTMMGELLVREVHRPARIQKKLIHILREQGVLATGGQQAAAEEETDGQED
ncbi:hypothetical protein CR970_02075 [Candidatus Saccharibacteria bacterium]|nr:MAG: hypothetical protein CR970_02075 [Candidatus Saccharibacteria bacterium]